ncbi:MAG: helix-turn-helix domain-containing protein [Clostridia bacterium]
MANQETISDYLNTYVSDNRNLEPDLLRRFLDKHDLSTMSIRDPLFLNIENYKTMNLNLFDEDKCIGCLTIWNVFREFRVSDAVLASYLRSILELAIKKYSYENTFDKAVVKQVLKDTIDGLPSNYDNIRKIKALKNDQEYVCVKIEISTYLSNLPIGYVCSNVEDSFSKSLVLEHPHNVVAFIGIDGLKDAEGRYLDKLKQRIQQMSETMDLHAGISDPFADIFSSRLYYLQASAALSNGRMTSQSERVFDFQDYALNELVINSLGELPIELYYFDGLRRLFQHDAESQPSYTNTLKTYLNSNMSITKTAADLFVHRSTLIERMSRIERDFGVDLKDPDMQLLIRILLKDHEIKGQITNKSL